MIDNFLKYLNSLADENGGFQASSKFGFLGVADGAVSEIASATYAAEIAQTLGVALPFPDKTAEFIQARQHADGYFKNLAPLPGCTTTSFLLYNTCVAIRGLKALGKSPRYDPRPWMDAYIRQAKTPGDYEADFYANSYAALEDEMNPDCFRKLADFLLARQDKKSGWLLQPGLKEAGYPIERNNPFNFHAVRFFHLAGKRIPRGDEILREFMKYQESDGSWKLGGVHGTFDACVAIRILGDDSEKYRAAIRRAAEWVLTCRREDGGFNHFGDKAIAGGIDNAPSEMDACYFHISNLTMAGKLPCKVGFDNNWIGWGHTLMNNKN